MTYALETLQKYEAELAADPTNTELQEEVAWWTVASQHDFLDMPKIPETTRMRRHREAWEAKHVRPVRDRLDHYC